MTIAARRWTTPFTVLAAALAVSSMLIAGCTAARLDPRTAAFPPPLFTPPQPVEARLSCGARVFLLEDHELPYVRLTLLFRGGSLHDPADRAGLARVAGAAWRTGGTAVRGPEPFDDAVESHGIEIHIAMGRETGSASLGVLSRDIDEGLSLLAEILLAPTFAEDRVRWAVGQIADDIRRQDDDPGEVAFRELRRALYRGHPRAVTPTEATVAAVTRADVVELHRRLVSGSAWTVAAVGDFDGARLLERLEELFGRLPGDGPEFRPPPVPPEPERQVVLVPRQLAQTTLLWAELGPGLLDPDCAALILGDRILGGGGFQSRLVRTIRSDRGLAYSVGSFYSPMREFGVLGVSAQTAPATTGEVWRLLDELMREAAGKGFGEEETAAAREAEINSTIFRYRDPGAAVVRRASLGLDNLSLDLDEQFTRRIAAATEAEVNRAEGAHLRPDAGVWVLVGPVDPEDPKWTERGRVTVVR